MGVGNTEGFLLGLMVGLGTGTFVGLAVVGATDLLMGALVPTAVGRVVGFVLNFN